LLITFDEAKLISNYLWNAFFGQIDASKDNFDQVIENMDPEQLAKNLFLIEEAM